MSINAIIMTVILVGLLLFALWLVYDLVRLTKKQKFDQVVRNLEKEAFYAGLTDRQREYLTDMKSRKPSDQTTYHLALESRIYALETKLARLESSVKDDGK